MNNFDKKWLQCVSRGRTIKSSDQEAPIGFAQKVLQRRRPIIEASAQDIWFRASIRALAAMTSLLAISIYLNARIPAPLETFRPYLENTVAQILMNL
jgi:hypothetical protein